MSTAAAASLWGLSGAVAKYFFNRSLDPLILTEVRLTLSAAVLWVYLAIFRRGSLRVDRADLPYFLLLGIFGLTGVQFAYLFTLSRTNVATTVFLQALAPALIMLYAALFRGETLSTGKVGALVLALAGVGAMLLGRTGGALAFNPVGVAAGFVTAGFAAFYTLCAKRGLAKYPPLTVLAYGLACGALFMWCVVPPWRPFQQGYGPLEYGYFVYYAVLGTVIPFGLYFRGLARLTPGQAAIVGTLEPVTGTLAALLLLGEHVNVTQSTGGLLVLAGLTLLRIDAHHPVAGRLASARNGS